MYISDAIIPISLVLCVFGIVYLYYSTRHRERMALIEKGLDASNIFYDVESMKQFRRATIFNIAFTLIGIGAGVGFAIILYHMTGKQAVYPACIFLFAGLGLWLSSVFARR